MPDTASTAEALPRAPGLAAPPEARTVAYLARRGVAAQWRTFLRAMVETLDAHLDTAGRSALMHAIGRRMATSLPLPPCDTLATFEAAINEALATAEWGFCRLVVDVEARRLVIIHAAAPAIGTTGEADGAWIGAVLEGLHGGWLAAQPGADPSLPVGLATYTPGEAVLHYGRHAA